MRAAVLGGGSWGTVFGSVLVDAGTNTTVWSREPLTVEAINRDHQNPRYLPGVPLPEALLATGDAATALDGADIVVLAVPSHALRENLERWAPIVPPQAVFVSLMKGVELVTLQRMSEVITEVTGCGPARVVAVSGPNLAREIVQKQPAATVVACADEGVARLVQEAVTTSYFRPYTNADVVGTEIGGTGKNVVAIAVGIAEGLGYGDNTKAAVITRGLAEISRLGVALGADPLTFLGLAGLGDMVATCTSPLSRNRTVGVALGQGRTLEEIQAGMNQVAEGVKSSRSLLALGHRHGVDLPMTEEVVGVLFEGGSPATLAVHLMARSLKSETYGLDAVT